MKREGLGQQFLSGEVSLLRNRLTDFEHIEQSERGAGERGVLEQADELPDLGGDHVAQRLGQDDQECDPYGRQRQRARLFLLAAGHRLQSATDDLRHVRAGEECEDDDRPDDAARRELRGDEELQCDPAMSNSTKRGARGRVRCSRC